VSKDERLERPAGQPADTLASPAPGRRERRRHRWTRRDWITVTILTLVSVTAGALIANALWNAATTGAGGVITAGSLNVELGDFTWEDVSPDVPLNERQGGSDAASLTSYQAMPGDAVELRQVIHPTLSGGNLVAELTVDWDTAAGPLAPGTSATYIVEDATGVQVAPASGSSDIGTPVTVEHLDADSGDLTVVITMVYDQFPDLALTRNLDSPSDTTSVIPSWTVTLSQVRGQA
jgi:alternate signal-mediated exported protein